MKKTIIFSLIASLGTFLFGYHTGIIAGTLLFITPEFQLTIFEQELVVCMLLLSGCGGSVAGGGLADYLGRKKTFFVAVVFLIAGTWVLMQAVGFGMLLVGRLLAGFAIGVITVIVPLYIAEISPPHIRGALVTIGQLMTSMGIFFSYVVTFAFAGRQDWREMFGFGFIPLALFLFGLFWIAESPAWSKSQSRIKEKMAPPSYFLKILWIGLILSVFQQITGINTVIYYSPRILELAGSHTTESAIFYTMCIGIVNVIFSIIALFTVDWLGRRTLLLGGLIGMTLSLFALGLTIYMQIGSLALISLFTYIACFALSLGPILGIILSEIFPIEVRGRAMGFAFFANWLSNALVSLTFLTLIHEIGIVMTFCLYGIICCLAFWFSWKMIPETKGKSFDEIQKSLFRT